MTEGEVGCSPSPEATCLVMFSTRRRPTNRLISSPFYDRSLTIDKRDIVFPPFFDMVPPWEEAPCPPDNRSSIPKNRIYPSPLAAAELRLRQVWDDVQDSTEGLAVAAQSSQHSDGSNPPFIHAAQTARDIWIEIQSLPPDLLLGVWSILCEHRSLLLEIRGTIASGMVTNIDATNFEQRLCAVYSKIKAAKICGATPQSASASGFFQGAHDMVFYGGQFTVIQQTNASDPSGIKRVPPPLCYPLSPSLAVLAVACLAAARKGQDNNMDMCTDTTNGHGTRPHGALPPLHPRCRTIWVEGWVPSFAGWLTQVFPLHFDLLQAPTPYIFGPRVTTTTTSSGYPALAVTSNGLVPQAPLPVVGLAQLLANARRKRIRKAVFPLVLLSFNPFVLLFDAMSSQTPSLPRPPLAHLIHAPPSPSAPFLIPSLPVVDPHGSYLLSSIRFAPWTLETGSWESEM
ncbi:unnamed protein product [Cyclocybe aegerita]|uniref:Uncharacterized protein n=1 Tax=Cyclocybe aegerita TaxID=1973307 RepID=A0A8S0X6L7_CYCAE|nr:unnamed protein product [Cyclocybe aegerita]